MLFLIFRPSRPFRFQFSVCINILSKIDLSFFQLEFHNSIVQSDKPLNSNWARSFPLIISCVAPVGQNFNVKKKCDQKIKYYLIETHDIYQQLTVNLPPSDKHARCSRCTSHAACLQCTICFTRPYAKIFGQNAEARQTGASSPFLHQQAHAEAGLISSMSQSIPAVNLC